jgi:hypothetical protein
LRCLAGRMPRLRQPLSDQERTAMINAAELAQALKGRRAGRGWKARCPAHEDRTPSLSISAGNGGMVLFKCHAGCPQGQVIDALRERGLWNTDVHSSPAPACSPDAT